MSSLVCGGICSYICACSSGTRRRAGRMSKSTASSFERRRIFEGPVLTGIDVRFDYGEVREISIGAVDGAVVLTVVHTDRRGVIRVISARPAKRRERRMYAEALQAGAVGGGARGPAG